MVDEGVAPQRPARKPAVAIEGHPQPEEMISTSAAAKIVGRSARQIERWVDEGTINGGRPRKGAHRWVDARHAVLIAVAGNRAHLIPEQWRYLIPADDAANLTVS